MRIEQLKAQKRSLTIPITITVETVEELEWMGTALSRAVHMEGVNEDSAQQEFYGKAAFMLNEMAVPYRREQR